MSGSAVSELLLSVDGVTVDYSGFKALDGFSMTLNRGETRVVIGPNGAGKSTLCDTIIGRPTLSVRDNLALAARRDRRWWKSLGTGIPVEERAAVEEALEAVALTHRADVEAGTLAHGEKQWLEIAMVMATGAELLLLDEPTAGMGPAETSRTAQLILGLGDSRTVLVIDHDMSFVEQLAAPVTVMHQGKFLKQGSVVEVRADPQVAAVYLGHTA